MKIFRIFLIKVSSFALLSLLACGGSDPVDTPASAAAAGGNGGGAGGTSSGGSNAAGTGGTSVGTGGTASGGTSAGGTSAGGSAGATSSGYPSGPYGKAVDAVFPNLSWQGYANYTFDGLSTNKPFGPVTMDDVRKSGKKWALVTLSESLCPGCQKTATQLKDVKPIVDAGCAVVDVLITTGFLNQPTKNDLDAWIKKYNAEVTVVMDPPGAGTISRMTLGERENGFIVDLETMKIVEVIKGSNSGAQPTVGELGIAKMKQRLGLP